MMLRSNEFVGDVVGIRSRKLESTSTTIVVTGSQNCLGFRKFVF